MASRMESAKASQKAPRRSQFCSKVMSSVKGSLSSQETGKLERIINEAEERDEVMAQGIATALDLAGLPPDDFDELVSLLGKAYENVSQGKDPFTKESLSKLESLLRNRVSEKALARMEADFARPDEEVLGAVKETLEKKSERSQKLKATPKKK